MPIKVTINRSECISDGYCWSVCPEFFEQSMDDDRSQVKEPYRRGELGTGEAPDALEACVKDAERGCPVQIIVAS